jgi:acetyl-CoA synthetase
MSLTRVIQGGCVDKATIQTVLKENRSFPPSKEFSAKSHIGNVSDYEQLWKSSQENPVAYWEQAAQGLHWYEKWHTAFEWKAPFAKWFLGAKINASYNCLDRHLGTPTENKKALIWEGEDGKVEEWTYRRLFERVCQLSHAMEKDLGLKAGDTAAIYMPLIPEAIVTMLACARIGVAHSVIFAGFASHAIRDRVNDAESKVIFTSDIGYRRGQVLELKKTVDTAVKETPSVNHVVVLRRQSSTSLSTIDRDWTEICDRQPKTHTAPAFNSEHPLFYLYTSGTTGKPKGIVHSTGGYMVGAHSTSKMVFDLKASDVYWCTADIGWITGHSYVVYGILSHGITSVIYEGAPMHPHPGRIWEIIDKHQVTILYTAPTAIRAFMRAGDEHPAKYKMQSLRLLGTVGEPINPEAWIWYQTKIGRGRCPIVDTWWQTETGSIMISPLPGVTATKPGSATRTLPGIIADVVDEQGNSCGPNEGGYLVIKHPWPSMLRTIHKDPGRFKETYFSKYPGIYFTGDGAHRDENGYFWIMGRVDDVLNVSGHRLGTMEIESALVSHPTVAEAAVVGRPDDLKGQAVVAFVTPKDSEGKIDVQKLKAELKQHVTNEIGALARPDDIFFTRTLPKTRSGKIMRRLLKDLAAGKQPTGDTTTLENPGLVELIS